MLPRDQKSQLYRTYIIIGIQKYNENELVSMTFFQHLPPSPGQALSGMVFFFFYCNRTEHALNYLKTNLN